MKRKNKLIFFSFLLVIVLCSIFFIIKNKSEKNMKKVNASYKTIYIRNDTIEKINKIASENNTSFNNVVISMINYCIDNNFNA